MRLSLLSIKFRYVPVPPDQVIRIGSQSTTLALLIDKNEKYGQLLSNHELTGY